MDELTLILSADQYQPVDDPRLASVSLTCGAITRVFTVTAQRRDAEAELLTLLGDFGGQVATLTFVNDAYAGTSNTDRNVYLLGAYLNGLPVPIPSYPGNAMFTPRSTVAVTLPSVQRAGIPAAPVAEPVPVAEPQPVVPVPEAVAVPEPPVQGPPVHAPPFDAAPVDPVPVDTQIPEAPGDRQ